jgi:hypothetical protein
LANREARVSAPSGEENKPKNQWAALCAAHELALKKPSCFVVERWTGIEPAIFCLGSPAHSHEQSE